MMMVVSDFFLIWNISICFGSVLVFRHIVRRMVSYVTVGFFRFRTGMGKDFRQRTFYE